VSVPARPAGRLVLLCGLSFSGKSTVARAIHTELGATVVSLDEINARRGLQGGQGVPISEWQRTHRIATAEVTAALRPGATVVVDDTSSPRFLRDGWRALAEQTGASYTLVFVATDRDEARARRDRNREQSSRPDVIDAVFDDHADNFEALQPDEDAICVRSDDDVRQWVRQHADRLSDPPAGE
jgi:predicted kinase